MEKGEGHALLGMVRQTTAGLERYHAREIYAVQESGSRTTRTCKMLRRWKPDQYKGGADDTSTAAVSNGRTHT